MGNDKYKINSNPYPTQFTVLAALNPPKFTNIITQLPNA